MAEENISKQILSSKGYLEGKYRSGQGKAHACCSQHTPVFNCRMYGTFNVRLTEPGVSITHFSPSITNEKNSYWFVVLSRQGIEYPGWAVRGHNSHQNIQTIEIITRELLPEELKEGSLEVYIHEKWSEDQINEWAKNQYWFQTFPFSPQKKANSEMLWNLIDIVNWSNKKVVDIGCHYGYFSFQASKKGACVQGIDINFQSLKVAKIIRNNIIQQDVKFKKASGIPFSNKYDILLYLSVHHQIDPTYKDLHVTINRLKNITNEHVFVELIIPPLFPRGSKLTEKQIDEIIGGKILGKYQHCIRGTRKLYWIRKNI